MGSLLIHNYLLSFKFSPGYNFNFKENLPGNKVSILCNKENNYCTKLELEKFIKSIENFSEKERAGWICGLGHGILKETPEENVQTFERMIRESFK